MSRINVIVAYAMANTAEENRIELADTATMANALAAVQEEPGFAAAINEASAFGIWGKVRPTDSRLREGDRVEIYRALRADPKDARRSRAKVKR